MLNKQKTQKGEYMKNTSSGFSGFCLISDFVPIQTIDNKHVE
jgi:hypothetical protein